MARIFLAGLIFFLISNLTHAQIGSIEILSRKEGIFLNENCKRTKTCDLKKVEYIVEDFNLQLDGDNLGTRFFAIMETNKTKDIEKYVFVNFLKGCFFSSQFIRGRVEIYRDHTYPRDKKPVNFYFPNWTIDSYDFDPVYSTVPGKPRYFGYRWNTDPGSFSNLTEKLYGQSKPPTPQVYLPDHIGVAYYLNNVAHNVSLQFRMCIYKSKDVPKYISHEKIDTILYKIIAVSWMRSELGRSVPCICTLDSSMSASLSD